MTAILVVMLFPLEAEGVISIERGSSNTRFRTPFNFT